MVDMRLVWKVMIVDFAFFLQSETMLSVNCICVVTLTQLSTLSTCTLHTVLITSLNSQIDLKYTILFLTLD